MSHLKMYPFGSATSFHGSRIIPSRPARIPPILKEILEGLRLEKSFAGETMFAAIFVVRVATIKARSPGITMSGRSNFANSTTGSQIGAPKTTIVALVVATPIKAKSAIVPGSPINCPST